MPKPKFQRADAFDQSKPTTPSPVPYINAGAMNSAIYENGAASFPMSGFEDPVEKENERLKGEIAELVELIQSRTSDLVAQDGTLLVYGFQLSPKGLIPPEDVSNEAWEQIGHLLFKLEGSLQWLIGDWLAYGLNLQYGDIPRLADHFGRDQKTLHHYKQICEKFEFTRRRVDLTFGHHEAVRALEPDAQDAWLAYAAEKHLSVAALRKELQGQFTPALSSGFDADKSYRAIKKLSQRDPSTLKPKQIAEGLGYITQARQWLDEMERRLKGNGNAAP